MAHLLRKLQKCRSVDICGSISTELYHNKYGIDQLLNNRNRSFSWEMYVLFRCIPTKYRPIAHFTSILRNKWSKKKNAGTLFFINARNRKNYLLFIKKNSHKKNPAKITYACSVFPTLHLLTLKWNPQPIHQTNGFQHSICFQMQR